MKDQSTRCMFRQNEGAGLDRRTGRAGVALLALHGGVAGLRDGGLLEGALACPKQHNAYAEAPLTLSISNLHASRRVRVSIEGRLIHPHHWRQTCERKDRRNS